MRVFQTKWFFWNRRHNYKFPPVVAGDEAEKVLIWKGFHQWHEIRRNQLRPLIYISVGGWRRVEHKKTSQKKYSNCIKLLKSPSSNVENWKSLGVQLKHLHPSPCSNGVTLLHLVLFHPPLLMQEVLSIPPLTAILYTSRGADDGCGWVSRPRLSIRAVPAIFCSGAILNLEHCAIRSQLEWKWCWQGVFQPLKTDISIHIRTRHFWRSFSFFPTWKSSRFNVPIRRQIH